MADTRDFSRLPPEEYKRRTREHWQEDPCGSPYSRLPYLSREYFDEIERHRYRSHPWILEDIGRFDIEGERVLEIGYGMGTDHLAMARRGGIMHGIDLTPANREITARRFELYGFRSELATGDAENMPYPDGSFDFVYSFGVIHHSPDTGRIVAEIRRLLKPGGRCYVTVYHRDSIFFWWTVYLHNFILRGGRRVRTLEQQLSLIEYPNVTEDLVIRLYRRREFTALFRGFRDVRCRVRHLIPADVTWLSALYRDPYRPARLLDLLGRRWGWYLVLEAVR